MITLSPLEDLTVQECADALATSVASVRRAEAERLLLAVRWADVHPPGENQLRRGPADAAESGAAGSSWTRQADDAATRGLGRRRADERSVQLGADGIPAIREFAAVELGVLLQTTTYVAATLMRDALELRHRLPATWHATLNGQVDVWKARRVATATRPLTVEQAAQVDARVAPALVGLPTGRALDVLEAAVLAADPAGHETRRRAEEASRYVALGRRPNAAGLRSLVCQTTAGDVARVDAMVAHLAEVLARLGDQDPVQVRRAKALVVLADPARACRLLAHGRAQAEPPTRQAFGSDSSCVYSKDERLERAVPQDADVPADDSGDQDPEGAETHVTAVDRAVAVGQALTSLGAQALQRLRPRTVLYVHLAEEALDSLTVTPGCGRPQAELARVRGLGPVGLQQLRDWIGEDRVDVRPVIDLAGQIPVDEYAIPPPMAELMELREPFEVFPWGTGEVGTVDLDHTVPFRPLSEGGVRGQTRPENLGPLGRHHHRAKTFGGFRCHQPLPGVYLWQTPSGHWFQVDHTGSVALGRQTPAILVSGWVGAPLTSQGPLGHDPLGASWFCDDLDDLEVLDDRYQPAGSGRPSWKPAADWKPTTARSANSASVRAPA